MNRISVARVGVKHCMEVLCLATLLTSPLYASPRQNSPQAKAALHVALSVHDTDTLSDTTTIVAHVTGSEKVGINRVEFSIDDNLVFTGQSVPYTYTWDTLSTTEGMHTVQAVAYDEAGKTAQSKVTITVDNQLTKGAQFHADAAATALQAGDDAKAVALCLRALKLAPDNLLALHTLSKVYVKRNDVPHAVDALSRATLPPGDIEDRRTLARLYIKMAEATSTTADFLTDASKAADLQAEADKIAIAAAPADPIERGDMRFAMHDLPGAVDDYLRATGEANATVPALNRLILADIESDRVKEAGSKLRGMVREKTVDEVTPVVQALLLMKQHQFQAARDMVQPGVTASMLPALIVAAYADLALRKQVAARDEANQARMLAPGLVEVCILNGITENNAIDADRSIFKAMELDPGLNWSYAVRGFQTLVTHGPSRFTVTDQLLDFALRRSPNSTYAMMVAALSLLAQNRWKDADPLLLKLKSLDPDAADVRMARGIYFSEADKTSFGTPEILAANKLDSENFADSIAPTPDDMIARVFRYRLPMYLSPSALYFKPSPPQAPAN